MSHLLINSVLWPTEAEGINPCYYHIVPILPFCSDAVYFFNRLLNERDRDVITLSPELAWRKLLRATRMGRQRLGQVIWSEDEHKSHVSAVPFYHSALAHIIRAFLKYHILREALCYSSPNIQHLSSYSFLVHRILCDICSLVYHLLPPHENSIETGHFCSLLSLEQCLAHTKESLEKCWINKRMKQKVFPQQRWPPTVWLDSRCDTPLPNDFSQAQEHGLGWATGPRETVNSGPSPVLSDGW